MFQSSQVLTLTVKRRAAVVSKTQTCAQQGGSAVGFVGMFAQQGGSNVASQFPYMSTQESTNAGKGKAVQTDDAQDDGNDIFFDMGEADFAAMEEIRRKEDMEIAEKIEEMRRIREDPLLHCEGDTDIEDIYVVPEENSNENQVAIEPEPVKRKKKTVKRRPGPTTRCHSSVQNDDILDYMPSSDEDEFPGFLKDEDGDAFQPITMVAPKGRKSRWKKIQPRK